MFLEDKPQGEITETLKPSAAIRIGHTMCDESKASHQLCALGAMWRGYGRTEEELSAMIANHSRAQGCMSYRMAERLALSQDLMLEISIRHLMGSPRLEIADWLEAQGF